MLRIDKTRGADGWTLLILWIILLVSPGCRPGTEADPDGAPRDSGVSNAAKSEEGLIRKISGASDFEAFIKSEPVAVVDFFAVWCGPCRELTPEMERMAVEFADQGVKFAIVDVDGNRELAQKEGISSIPNVKIFADGELIGDILGNYPDKIRRKIESALKNNAEKTGGPVASDTFLAVEDADRASDPETAEDAEPTSPSNEDALPGADGRIKKMSPSDSFDEVIQSAPVVVIDFNATWCAPCKRLGPYLERMAESYQSDSVSFFSADTDEMSELSEELGIEGIPDIRIYVQGQPSGKIVGCEPVEIMKGIDQAVQSVKNPSQPSEE